MVTRRYDPPVRVELLSSRQEASQASPEDALLSHLSSLAKQDIEWSAEVAPELSIVKSPAGAVEIAAGKARMKMAADILVPRYFTKRVDVEKAVIIHVEVDTPDGKGGVVPIILSTQNGKWIFGGLPANHVIRTHHLNLLNEFTGDEKVIPLMDGWPRERAKRPVSDWDYSISEVE